MGANNPGACMEKIMKDEKQQGAQASGVERIVIFLGLIMTAALYEIKMLPFRPRITWNRLWVRNDEFHQSLEMDVKALIRMSDSEREEYMFDLCRRRNIAHNRDIEK
jgi:hypothetical protein